MPRQETLTIHLLSIADVSTHLNRPTHTNESMNTQGLLALVRAHGIGAVNLVNKAKADPLLAQIHTIKVALLLITMMMTRVHPSFWSRL